MEQDINDAFEDIFYSEELLTKSAYEKGLEKGKEEGNINGFHLGYHRGAEIGAELGYYLGVVEIHIDKTENKDSKKVYNSLQKVKELIENYPKNNSEDIDILEKLDDIRAQFKKLCSLLKIDGIFPESDKLNF